VQDIAQYELLLRVLAMELGNLPDQAKPYARALIGMLSAMGDQHQLANSVRPVPIAVIRRLDPSTPRGQRYATPVEDYVAKGEKLAANFRPAFLRLLADQPSHLHGLRQRYHADPAIRRFPVWQYGRVLHYMWATGEIEPRYDPSSANPRRRVQVWYLTDLGRQRLAAIDCIARGLGAANPT
jgi:hypothetical protein